MTTGERPSTDAVSKFVGSIFDGRKFRGLEIRKVEFSFFPSAYTLSIAFEGRIIDLKIPSEFIDEAISGSDLFKRRKLKKMVKEAVGLRSRSDED